RRVSHGALSRSRRAGPARRGTIAFLVYRNVLGRSSRRLLLDGGRTAGENAAALSSSRLEAGPCCSSGPTVQIPHTTMTVVSAPVSPAGEPSFPRLPPCRPGSAPGRIPCRRRQGPASRPGSPARLRGRAPPDPEPTGRAEHSVPGRGRGTRRPDPLGG